MSLTADEEAFEAWRRLRQARGAFVTVINLYELVARARGIEPGQLTIDERATLGSRALQVMDPRFEYIPGSERPEAEPIELTPYDWGWPAQFEAWKQKLLAALPVPPRRIEHVGSTSVPGLPAKPVVDIQVSVDDPNDEAGYVPAIESAGVQLRNRDSEHRYFRPFTGSPRNVHVHVCEAGSEWERRHILFRDYLRSSQEARQEYLLAKVSAAARWRDDRIAYTEAKGETIRRLAAAADEWARQAGWRLPPELSQGLPQGPGQQDRDGPRRVDPG